jgi:PAS domain-containing protein
LPYKEHIYQNKNKQTTFIFGKAMTIETLSTLLYVWLSLSLCFPVLAIWLIRRHRLLKKELIGKTQANLYYEEMLYAAKDGYLTLTTYKGKEYQYCSRRLSTMLNLKNGENSTLAEVLSLFDKPDADTLNLAFNTLKRNGLSFERILKSRNKKTFMVSGTRINSADAEISSNCLWFRDISATTAFIEKATNEADACREKVTDFRILIDNLPYPVWLRNSNLDVTILNKHYLKLLGLKDFKELRPSNSVLHDLGNTTNLLELAKNAKESNTAQKKQISILSEGELKNYEITEMPYYDSSLKTTHIIGSLIDITGFNEAKRNYQSYIDSHLEILSSMDTAFCILDSKHHFTFGNEAFLHLWGLPENFLDAAPHYNAFLDKIRESNTLPEVADFKIYKEEENKAFDNLINTGQLEDLLYIPDGRTIRRIRTMHSDGSIIAYEDISERLAAARNLGDIKAFQQSILDQITDSVIIFSPSLKLKSHNRAFRELWDLPETALKNNSSLRELLDLMETHLPELEDWSSFRDNMIHHITSCTPFALTLKNKQKIKVKPGLLADSSLMITFHPE